MVNIIFKKKKMRLFETENKNIDQYNFKIKSVIVSWCRRPPKDVAFVEVIYEKNCKTYI